MRILGVVLMAFGGLCACESPVRGCLDVEAINLDVSADKPCKDDCCNYPDLICLVSQVFGNEVWRQDSTYTNDLGQAFSISSVVFYLSNFELGQAGSLYEVSDSVALAYSNNADTLTDYFTDDFILVRRIPVSYTVGKFRKSGNFDQFRCFLGLNAEANNIVPSKAPSGHPLARQTDSLWLNNTDRFVWMQIVLNKNAMTGTPLDTLRFTSADFGNTPVEIMGTNALSHKTGFNFEFILTVDYEKMFSGVDFANTGSIAWKSKIISNLGHTFEVSQ